MKIREYGNYDVYSNRDQMRSEKISTFGYV